MSRGSQIVTPPANAIATTQPESFPTGLTPTQPLSEPAKEGVGRYAPDSGPIMLTRPGQKKVLRMLGF